METTVLNKPIPDDYVKSGVLCPDCSDDNIVSELLAQANTKRPIYVCPKCKYRKKTTNTN